MVDNPNGYNQVAELYVEARDAWQSIPHLDRMLDPLLPESQVFDVGCGTGVPVAASFDGFPQQLDV